jgi:hypothetical protein
MRCKTRPFHAVGAMAIATPNLLKTGVAACVTAPAFRGDDDRHTAEVKSPPEAGDFMGGSRRGLFVNQCVDSFGAPVHNQRAVGGPPPACANSSAACGHDSFYLLDYDGGSGMGSRTSPDAGKWREQGRTANDDFDVWMGHGLVWSNGYAREQRTG